MNDRLGDVLAHYPRVRRFVWRTGRKLYAAARHEQIQLEISDDGEAYLQAQVIKHAAQYETLQILDIGANQGDWTAAFIAQRALKQRDAGSLNIHLFEPVPATRARLLDRLPQISGGHNCVVHPYAVSDKAGTAPMAIMSETGGTNSLHDDGHPPPGGWVEVQTVRLTDFTMNYGIDRIHLMKCDTEGHDFHVIQSAHELLEANRIDVLQFEYNHRWIYSRTYLKDVFDLIRNLSYRLGKLVPDGLEIYSEWHPELDRYFQSNYVLIANHATSWFKLHSGTFDVSNTYA